jgi:hypothetical protein
MAAFDVIGGVSVTLKRLLEDRIDVPADAEIPQPVPRVHVTIGTPRDPDAQRRKEDARVNLFLYRVTENGHLANMDRNAPSGAYGRPPLALDLHYLLTAYGTTTGTADANAIDERVAHYVLGSAMRVLHDFAVITDDLESGNGQPIVHASLLGEFERVKIGLDRLTLEDVSKIWTALNLAYRVSAPYVASVVQIESALPRRYPRLVGADGGARPIGTTMRSPTIVAVHVRRPDDDPDVERPQAYARIGDTLVLRGADLGGSDLQIEIDGVDVTAGLTSVRDERVTLIVPDDPALQPGPRGVRASFPVAVPDTGDMRPGAQSNVAAFVLVPEVRQVRLLPGRELEVNGVRLHDPDLICQTIIDELTVDSAAYTTATPTRIGFTLPEAIGAGTHSVRVRVGGADSLDDASVTVP